MNHEKERIRKLERLLIPTMKHEYQTEKNPVIKAQYKLILDELELEHGERVVEQFRQAIRTNVEGYVV